MQFFIISILYNYGLLNKVDEIDYSLYIEYVQITV